MKNNEKVIEKIKTYCMNQSGAYETRPFGNYPICYRVMGKIFAQFHPEAHFFKVTLKSEPEQAEIYRQIYSGIVVRGYHCPPIQQPYWNTVDLDMFEDMGMLCQMIDEAYDAVVKKLSGKAKKQLSELSGFEYKDLDGSDSGFAILCDKLDSRLDELVGAKFERNQYEKYNLRDTISDVIVVYRNGQPIACGGFKMYDEEHAELKRIFVDSSAKGMGLGAEIIRRLEARAKIKGYKWCMLETSEPLEAACHVYKKAGYKIIPNYGSYINMEDSICMERKI